MFILAIETSCDETAIAILQFQDKKIKILANIVSSQVKLHAKYGGVYPMLAKREHQKNLPFVLKKALKKAGFLNYKFPARANKQNPKIDLIAVTVGPGLEPCLWTGINFAKDLAKKWEKPIVPVNHIESHIVANLVRSNFQCAKKASLSSFASFRCRETQLPISNFKTIFPAVCLVVSGGHTQLILMKDIGKYKIIGETKDDAAGECFDKTARILGLGYPGGPIISQQAEKLKAESRRTRRGSLSFAHLTPIASLGQMKAKLSASTKNQKLKISLPRPMIYQKNYDFSFSGLKTAVLYDFKNRPAKIRKSKQYIQEMAAEVQQSIIDVLIKKTIKTAKDYKAKSIILGGGVAANKELQRQFKKRIKKEIPNIQYLSPDIKFCTDNAVMTAVAGYFNCQKTKGWKEIKANANLRINQKP